MLFAIQGGPTGRGYLGEDICDEPFEKKLEGFRIMWDHLGWFGIIPIHVGRIWKHLRSCGVICDHLGPYVCISAHLGSSGFILDHLGSFPDSFGISWGNHLGGDIWRKASRGLLGRAFATHGEAVFCNRLQNFHKNPKSLSVFESTYHHLMCMVRIGCEQPPKMYKVLRLLMHNDSETSWIRSAGRVHLQKVAPICSRLQKFDQNVNLTCFEGRSHQVW